MCPTMQYQIELYHALMQYGSNRLHIWLLFIRFLDHNTFGLEFNSTLLGTTEHIAQNVLNVA